LGWRATPDAPHEGAGLGDLGGRVLQGNEAMGQFLRGPLDKLIGGVYCKLAWEVLR